MRFAKIPFEKSEAETRDWGAMLSPSCAQRKCKFFVAQRGSASRGCRSPFCKRQNRYPRVVRGVGPGLRRGLHWSLEDPAFSSSLLCPFLPFALTQAVIGPCLVAIATANSMRRPAPSVTPNSKPRRRLHAMHAVARREGRPLSEATAAGGRRFVDASSCNIPTVRNA